AAPGHQVGITPLDGDLLDRDAKLLAGEHRPYRGVALAVRGGTGEDGGRAVGVDLDGAVLVWPASLAAGPGDLDVGGHPDAELERVAGLAPTGLLRAEPFIAGGRERLLQRSDVVARVVQRAERGPVRLGELGQQVLAAYLGRVHSGLRGEQVNRAV